MPARISHVVLLICMMLQNTALARGGSGLSQVRSLYKNENYIRAAEKGYAYLKRASGKRKEALLYYTGSALYKVKAYQGAYYFYSQILDMRTKSRYFGKALVRSLILATLVEKDFDLGRRISNYPLGWFGRRVRNKALYLRGKYHYESGEVVMASRILSKISRKSDYYPDALLIRGLAKVRMRSYGKALPLFVALLKVSRQRGGLRKYYELANINIARVHYAMRNYKRALKYYLNIPKDSSVWLEALFESSWAFLAAKNINMSLGKLHNLQSPYLSDRFFPESYIIKANILFKLCKYVELEKSIEHFYKTYQGIISNIAGLVNYYKGNTGYLYQVVMEGRSVRQKRGNISEGIRARIYFDGRLKDYARQMVKVKKEKEILADLLDDRGRSSLLKDLRQAVVREERRLKGIIGDYIWKLLNDMYNEVMMVKERIARVELEKRTHLKDQLLSSRVVGVESEARLMASVSDGFEFWPFREEYWKDELGHYVFFTYDECSK